MKHISILVPERAVLACIDGPRYFFMAVNELLKVAGKQEFFNVELVGLSNAVKIHDGCYTVHTNSRIQDVAKTDLIFVPALIGEMKAALELNKDFIPWIINQHKLGAEVASLCIGSFLLASTGLLNGKKCSSHWKTANEFRKMFPDVILIDDRIVTEEQGLYSSGGATSYWNLLLYLIEKYTDREIAVLASKVFAIDIERHSQSPFIMFNGQKGHADESVKKAQEFIENNVAEKISVDDLAFQFAIGKRHFTRRFKMATNNTPIEYIQRVKIEAAKKYLESSRKNINEVMYEVGYTDIKSFRSVFKKITGLSPGVYRNKYNKKVIALEPELPISQNRSLGFRGDKVNMVL